jgi:hypothetical protein
MRGKLPAFFMKAIFEGQVYLEKFPGKGGWTFARIPREFTPSGKYFGMTEIRGRIDAYSFEKKHLMPAGDGTVFFPVSKEIRKLIQKEAGDPVFIQIFQRELPEEIPAELEDCLKDDPGKLESFLKLSDSDQKRWIEAIYSSSDEDQKAKQILRLLKFLS